MPTQGEWNVLSLTYLTYYEKQAYISWFMSRDDIIWMEIPQENIIKWKYRKGEENE